MSPKQTMMREAMEEASIPEHLSQKVQPVTCCSMMMDVPNRGLVLDTEFIYDLQVETSFQPLPLDGEVHGFYLMNLDEVKQRCLLSEFTPEATLVVIDFLVRHGALSAENERDYLGVVQQLRQNIPLPAIVFQE